ncbi:MAG: hypothetical protein GYB32_00300 [Algicola sp.]|nr:hypothetical protein [Algicola sp.]
MKLQILLHWRKVNLAINAVLILFFVACKSTSNIPNSPDFYYQAINDIIDNNPFLTGKRNDLYQAYISSGKFTEKDIETYKKRISRFSNKLYFKERNTLFMESLNYESLTATFSTEEKSKIARALSHENEFNSSQLDAQISLVKDGFGHSFSSPIYLEDKLIFSHTYSISKFLSYSKVYIYVLEEQPNQYTLKKVIQL